ncbi:sulfotransferase family 2 domain-containing protein [Halalkalibacter lacteus]|uniref:sulfotransferase family 2 domain-containing protein n=1 Tax=Halalkalibacter lacteus TaxID=3090663 RepID=UPI002FC69E45
MPATNNSKNGTVIFIHIPKTGGLTLRRILDNQYPKHERYRFPKTKPNPFYKLTKNELNSINCLYGHFKYGIHSKLTKPFTYITVLRDPVERVISTYFFILQNSKNRMHHTVKQMTFEEFVASDHSPVSNHQTRFVSGKSIPDLEVAKKNLEKHFAVVGITEMYAQSIFLMSKHLGWNNVQYTKKNITKHRLKQNDFSKETIELIRKKNELDIKLYEYAKQLLQKRMDGLNPACKEQLANFVKRHVN